MSQTGNTRVYREQASGNIVSKAGGSVQFTVTGTATLAEVNAGKTILPGIPGMQIKVVGGRVKANGAFETLTAIELQESDGSPVIVSWAQAQLTDGAVFNLRSTTSGQTIGAGFAAALTAGNGVKLVKTGTAGATATSLDYVIDYVLVPR